MEWSFAVSGTKQQVTDALGSTNVGGDPDGLEAIKFANALVANDDTQPDSDSHEVRYSIASSGQPGGAGLSYVSFSFAVSYAAKETP